METLYKILPLLIVIAIAILVIKVILPLWMKFKLKELSRSRPIISIQDKDGFAIYELQQQVRNIKWNEINTIDLVNKQKLQILFKDNTTLLLQEKEYIGWLSLMKAIPENAPMNKALADFKTARFSNLSCCHVCGKIAVKDGECLNCISDTYEKYCKDAESFGEEIKPERTFIKENQLDWFSAFVDGAKVDFYAKEILYDNCPNWSPSVTAFEVIKYEKEQNEDDAS